MVRIPVIDINQAIRRKDPVLSEVTESVGAVPNIIATMAQSPAVASAYLVFNKALSSGVLAPRIRELIALVVSEENGCDYCVAFHTALAKGTGMSIAETCAARVAHAGTRKERGILRFVQKLVRERGMVADEDVNLLRQHGCSDPEISEVVANVALNIFTNYFNLVAGTELDFPPAPVVRSFK